MINMLKEIGCDTKEKIEFIRKQRNDSNYHFIDLQEKINQLTQLYRSIEHNNAAETLSDLVENELATMDTAIEEAAIRIEVNGFFFSIIQFKNKEKIEFTPKKQYLGNVESIQSCRFWFKIGGEQ